jgi:hypothetical protein
MEHRLLGQVALKNRSPISLSEKGEKMQPISSKECDPSTESPGTAIDDSSSRQTGRSGPLKCNKAHGDPWALLRLKALN